VTAPHRLIRTPADTYVVDPYVRDAGGRFAEHPTEPLPPLRVLEAAGAVQVIANGAVRVCADDAGGNYWRVRTIRDDDGTFRVLYLEDD
jgi:hypothetical protein